MPTDGCTRAAKKARVDNAASPLQPQPASCAAALGAMNPLLDLLPSEVLINHVLPLLEPDALCALLAVCTRTRALLTDPVVDALTWGSIARCLWDSPLLLDAVGVAGSFRSYAVQKKRHMQQGVAEWKTPCEFEMQASLLRITAAASSSPSNSPSPSPRTPTSSRLLPCPSASPTPSPSTHAHATATATAATAAATTAAAALIQLTLPGASSAAQLNAISRMGSAGSDDTRMGAPPPNSPGGSLQSVESVGSEGCSSSGSVGQPPSAHILFLLDGSGSVGDEEFAASTSFIARAAADAKLRSNRPCKIAVMQFSNDVRVEWEDGTSALTDDLDAFKATIQSMVRMNGGTNIAAALSHAGKVLKKDAGADAAKVIVLITDGRVDGYQAKEARHVAAMLADEQPCTTMFAYGVGRGVDRAELLSIIGAARPSAGSAFHAPEARYLDLFHREEAPW